MARGRADFLLAEPFYETVKAGKAWTPSPGQLCWANVVYPYDPPKVLEFVTGSYSAWTHEARFKIRTLTPGVLPSSHMPIQELGLQMDENLFVHRGKRRLVLILGSAPTRWYQGANDDTFLVAPCYSFKARHHQRFILEVQAFLHPNLFYLPDNPLHGHEGAVRLEFIQPTTRRGLHALLRDEMHTSLSPSAYRYLVYHLARYVNGAHWDEGIRADMETYADLLLTEG